MTPASPPDPAPSGPAPAEQALAALRDAHDRQSLELARVRAELEQLLEASIEMSVQAEAGRSAELVSRAKSEFLATISHEIRTPLHGILGNAELLLGTPLDDGQRRSVELLRSSAQALTVILNDVLDFSKIESGRLSLQHHPFDLAACIRDAVALFESVARDRGLTLNLEMPPSLPTTVRGDATRLRQVLLNLLSNALKFTDTGGVTLRVETDPAPQPGTSFGREPPTRAVGAEGCSDPDHAAPTAPAHPTVATRFAVVDTGIGIPDDRLDLLFQPFQQIDTSMTRRHGGTGLGLAISQHLVGLMGGRIRVHSRAGQGSVFEFPITWEVVSTSDAIATGADTALDAGFATRHPLRILLVEDNPVNQIVAMQMLARLGYEAALASDGESAVQSQAQSAHDLVLMDIQMPGIDGIEACRRIRAMPTTRRARIVALTANASETERASYLRAGMDGHLAKPFELRDLAAELARAFDALQTTPGASAAPP